MFEVTANNQEAPLNENDDGGDCEENVERNNGKNVKERISNETIITYLNHECLSFDVVSNILLFPPHNFDMVSVSFDFEREFNQLQPENATSQERRNIQSLETSAEIYFHVFKERETRVFNSHELLSRAISGEDTELLSNCRRILNLHQVRKLEEDSNIEKIRVIHKSIELEEGDISVSLTPFSSTSQSMNALDAHVCDQFYSDDEFSEFSEGEQYDVVDLLSSDSDSGSDSEYSSNDHLDGETPDEDDVCELPIFDSRLISRHLENLNTDKHCILRFDENSGMDFKTQHSLLGSRDLEIDKHELNLLDDVFFSHTSPIVNKFREEKTLYHLLLVALCRDIGLSAIIN